MSEATAKVSVITDSTSSLNRDLAEKYNIGIVPISIYSGGKVYRDWVDINPNEAYELFLKNPDDFTTSPSSPGQFLEVYRQVSSLVSGILCITISSKLSTCYNIACNAKEQAKKELPGISIEVMDSLNVTASEGFIALAAARAASEGKDLDEVVSIAKEVRGKARFIILLDTIQHVYRTGRIPKIASKLGSALNIKPILTNSPDGKVSFAGAVRNKERGLERIIKMMRSEVGDRAVHIAVMHAYAPDEAKILMERVSKEFNHTELWLTEFSPVMGYACGTGALGFAFYPE